MKLARAWAAPFDPRKDGRRRGRESGSGAVQHHLKGFLAEAEETDPWRFGVASWVERDFRAYRRCGTLAHGFARARCVDCGQEQAPRALREKGTPLPLV